MQHCSCLLLDLFTAQKYHIIMVDLNVLSEVGGFKHYYLRVLKHPKRPPKYAPVTITLTHSLPLSLTHLLTYSPIHSLTSSLSLSLNTFFSQSESNCGGRAGKCNISYSVVYRSSSHDLSIL